MSKNSLTFFNLLFLLFLGLKLGGVGVVAEWSWWWVCAPLWGPVVFLFSVVLLLMMVVGLYEGGDALRGKGDK